ncbi:beta strand repeat-containing protein, partial [Sphingomonas sp. 2378]|uniref:beta strand repeat-containing protein n=1 Tax=Sphingomonas sp. 2378 TaxID=1219748 RepID=UPI00311AD903
AVTVTATSAAYADKNAGTGKRVTVSGMALNGADADNYVLRSTSTSGNVGEITARQVVVTTTGRGAKAYDGTNALGAGQFGSLVFLTADGDALTQGLMRADGVRLDISGVTGVLADRNAGTGKSVDLTGYVLDGNTNGNYVLSGAPAHGLADIARAQLTLTAVADSKVYDGTATSTGVVLVTGLMAGDTVTAGQAFDSRNAGARTIRVNGVSLSDGNGGDNYVVALRDANGTIAKRDLATTVTVNNKVYDGTTTATGSFGPLQNLIAGDDVSAHAAMNFVDRNAGANKNVTIGSGSLTGADAGNYNLVPLGSTATATIDRASLILTAGSDIRQYDGTTSSAGTVTMTGLVAGDRVSGLSQSFDSKNAGARILRIDRGYAISDGNGGDNYVVTLVDIAGAITQRVLTTAVSVDSKVYDGTLAASGTFGDLQNLVVGDRVTLSGGALSFADRHAGTGKAVNVTGAVLSGADAANYVLSGLGVGTGTITARALSLNAVSDTKVYDGTRGSAAQVQAIGLVGGDAFSATQSFDTRNAGNALLTIDGGWTIADGNGGNNYVVTTGGPVSGLITPKLLQATGVVNGKVYDGTTAATGSMTGLFGVVTGDDVAFSGNGLFAFVDRNAGTAKALTVSGVALSGGDAGNYALDRIAYGTADIAKAVLTFTAVDDAKTYDGTNASNGVVGVTGLVNGDTLSGLVQTFASKDAGHRSLGATGWTINDGNGGGNYAVVTVGAVGTIAKKRLTGQLTSGVAKTYDGTSNATLLPVNLDGVIAGDALDLTTASATYADRNVGTGKRVTVSGMVLGGTDAANYVLLNDHASADVGAITPRLVSISVSGRGAKTYDGTDLLSASQHGSLVFLAADGDTTTQALMLADGIALDMSGATGTLGDRHAGMGKSLLLTGYGLSGNGLGNYALASGNLTALADVARASLVLAATGDTKVYDGSLSSAGSVTASGLIGNDRVSATQAFDSRNAGDRLITVNGFSVDDGNGGDNYVVTLRDAAGTITRRTLTAAVSVQDKIYDGTTGAVGRFGSLGNMVSGDDVAASASFAFADRNVGVNKSVTLTNASLTGADAGNYVLAPIASGTASIGKATLTLAASGDSKVYDGTNASNGAVTVSGLMAGDQVNGLRQSFDGRNVGNRTLTVDNWTIDDGNAGGNYAVVKVDATGAIARKLLTGQLTGAVTKRYDGTTTATLSPVNLDGVVAGDALSVTAASASYADRNVGTGKRVTVSGLAVNGADSGNYLLQNTAVSADIGTITPRDLLVTLNNVSKTQGQVDPALSFTVGGDGMVSGDSMSGVATRSAGEGAGTYTISGGSLSAGSNYRVAFTNGVFTINRGSDDGIRVITPEVIREAGRLGNQLPPVMRDGTNISVVFGSGGGLWFPSTDPSNGTGSGGFGSAGAGNGNGGNGFSNGNTGSGGFGSAGAGSGNGSNGLSTGNAGSGGSGSTASGSASASGRNGNASTSNGTGSSTDEGTGTNRGDGNSNGSGNRADGSGSGESTDLMGLTCASDQNGSARCAPSKGAGLPYPTNRVITPTIRFIASRF